MWTCISIRPGARYRPSPLTTIASSGTRTSAAGPRVVISASRTMTVWRGSTRGASMGTTVMLVKAIGRGGAAAGTACDWRETHAAQKPRIAPGMRARPLGEDIRGALLRRRPVPGESAVPGLHIDAQTPGEARGGEASLEPLGEGVAGPVRAKTAVAVKSPLFWTVPVKVVPPVSRIVNALVPAVCVTVADTEGMVAPPSPQLVSTPCWVMAYARRPGARLAGRAALATRRRRIRRTAPPR